MFLSLTLYIGKYDFPLRGKFSIERRLEGASITNLIDGLFATSFILTSRHIRHLTLPLCPTRLIHNISQTAGSAVDVSFRPPDVRPYG